MPWGGGLKAQRAAAFASCFIWDACEVASVDQTALALISFTLAQAASGAQVSSTKIGPSTLRSGLPMDQICRRNLMAGR